MSACSDCAALGRDCCHARTVDWSELTAADLARLRLTGRPLRRLVRYVEGVGRRIPVLRAGKLGACVLLASDGCTLPVDLRPLFCRLAPLGVRDGRLYAAASPEECLAVERACGSAPLLCALLGTTLREVVALDEQAKREAR